MLTLWHTFEYIASSFFFLPCPLGIVDLNGWSSVHAHRRSELPEVKGSLSLPLKLFTEPSVSLFAYLNAHFLTKLGLFVVVCFGRSVESRAYDCRRTKRSLR